MILTNLVFESSPAGDSSKLHSEACRTTNHCKNIVFSIYTSLQLYKGRYGSAGVACLKRINPMSAIGRSQSRGRSTEECTLKFYTQYRYIHWATMHSNLQAAIILKNNRINNLPPLHLCTLSLCHWHLRNSLILKRIIT